MIIGAIVAVIVLGLAAVFGGLFVYRHFTKPSSPEDQIRAIVQKKADEFNAPNYSYDPQLVCKANVAQDEKEFKEARKLASKAGTISISVANIHVTGDQATADTTFKFQKVPDATKTESSKFIKEDGKWKSCDPPSSSSDDQGNGDSGN